MAQDSAENVFSLTLIEKQKNLAVSIENKRSSAVKYGVKRSREAFKKIYIDIENFWKEFLENDQVLNELAAEDTTLLDQPYFKEKKKDVADQIYEKAISFLFGHYPDLMKEETEKPSLSMTSIPSTSSTQSTTSGTSISESTLLKISEVLLAQQQFQEQIQKQIELMTKTKDTSQEGLKKPRVEIPVFDGNINVYKSFKDTFMIVTSHGKMSDIEKLTLLKGKVTGIAGEYISHIKIADKNYEKAWSTLDDRFDDPVVIINKNVDDILDMQPIPDNDIRALERALNLIQGVANSMELLNIDPNQVGLVRAIIRKLGDQTSGELTRFICNPKEFPDYSKLIEFIIHHLSILRARGNRENRTETRKNLKDSIKPLKQETKSHATSNSDPTQYRCFICFGPHLAPLCDKLMTSDKPIDLLKHYNLCVKCASHKFNKRRPCTKKVCCDICKEEHLTVIHGKADQSTNSYFCGTRNAVKTEVILPTAVATLIGNNAVMNRRILIDVCSQASYIEDNTLRALNIPTSSCNISIIGVEGEVTGKVKAVANIQIKTSFPSPTILNVEAYVVKRVTRHLPCISQNLKSFNWNKPLADTCLEESSHVPVLLGANVAAQIFLPSTEVCNGFLLQNTRFGWIVAGSANQGQERFSNMVSSHISLAELEHNVNYQRMLDNFEIELKEFWDLPVTKSDIEEISSEFCEQLYVENHRISPDGRYMVPIPWKKSDNKLGNSYSFALKCLLAQEKRFHKCNELKKLSHAFMQEYIELGHMTVVPHNQTRVLNENVYYIPYHCILRKDAVTTKLRNVFNASAKTSTGISLNQIIHVGPKLQTHIFNIITRIRQFKYIYSADITKMYRQIELLPEDREKIRILYREEESLPIKEYVLNTVTYGMDCAP